MTCSDGSRRRHCSHRPCGPGAGRLCRYPDRNGRIAFQAQTDQGSQIFKMRANGHDLLQVGGTMVRSRQVILDPSGRLITAVLPTEHVGHAKTISWGNLWWPSPMFLPDGRAFAFGNAGILELKVDLPKDRIIRTPEGGSRPKQS